MTQEEAKKGRSGSFLWNWISLVLLVLGVIVGQWALQKVFFAEPQPSEEEVQTVLEEVGSSLPMEVSESIQMTAPAGSVAEIPPPREAGEKKPVQPSVAASTPPISPPTSEATQNTLVMKLEEKPAVASAKPKLAKRPKKKETTPKKEAATSPKGPVDYTQPDAYTDGGPLDLDRHAMQETIDTEKGVTVYRTSAVGPNTRDYFIPFEKTK